MHPSHIIIIHILCSKESTEDELRSAFAAHGEIKKITLPTDKFTGRPRGFAFVQMANADATAAAISALNESDFNGRTIYVSESLPKDQVQKRKPERKAARGEYPCLLISWKSKYCCISLLKFAHCL